MSITLSPSSGSFTARNDLRANGGDSVAGGVGSKGNGDSYEGKVDEYLALDRLGICGQGPDYVSSIVRVDQNGNAMIVRQNCADVAPIAVAVQDFDVSPDAPEILTMNGELFENKTYLETAPNRGIWACRAKLPVANTDTVAKITVRVFQTAAGIFKSILSYAVYDAGNKLLNIRKSTSMEMKRTVERSIAKYKDAKMVHNSVFLNIHTKSKLGVFGFHFQNDPRWKSTQGVDETLDQEVLHPLGRFRSEKVTCYGDERPSP